MPNLANWRRMAIAIASVVILSIPWYLAQRDAPLRPLMSGKVVNVVDGDTLDVVGIGRVRLVGVNTPEENEPGYREAMEFLAEVCLGRNAELDIDDESPKDHYGRTLAVVYIDGTNVNAQLIRTGHAEILYLPPSEFDPHSWVG